MQGRRLILDANILVRAVLGVRVRELIERYCESAAFYVAESNVERSRFSTLRKWRPGGGIQRHDLDDGDRGGLRRVMEQ